MHYSHICIIHIINFYYAYDAFYDVYTTQSQHQINDLWCVEWDYAKKEYKMKCFASGIAKMNMGIFLLFWFYFLGK